MKQQEFTNLLDKYLSGTATEQEQQTLIDYYNVLQKEELAWDTTEMGNQDEVHDLLLNRINNRINASEKKYKSKRPQWLAIAASLFMMLSLGGYFLINGSKKTKPQNQQTQVNIKPGGNKAVLFLADGKKIILNDVKNGEIAQQDGITITKTEDGKLVYNTGIDETPTIDKEFVYNIVVTPRGGQYQIDLPDGTKVWLNAQSSLKYPTKFGDKERVVELKGEGYFEVTKDKAKPFKVVTENQKIEVFGTHFNVNAYTDEPAIKTTLLEGSVKVYQFSTHQAQFLKPGQQSVLTAKSFNIQEVDVEEAIAWTNGNFLFNNEDIKTAMRKLARWYDVEVSYDGDFRDIYFGGSFSRFSDLNESIKVLESTNKFKCKIEGRRINIKR